MTYSPSTYQAFETARDAVACPIIKREIDRVCGAMLDEDECEGFNADMLALDILSQLTGEAI